MTPAGGLALAGLEGRAKGSPCTTPCAPDCTWTCHERHVADTAVAHDQYYCDQIRIGRDVTELRPDIRHRFEAQLAGQR